MNESETDAVELLLAQHREMARLFALADDAVEDAKKKALFTQLADMMMAHMKAEEEILYPAAHQARTEDELLESLEEHLSLKRLLADMDGMEPTEKAFEAKFKVLREQAEHHHMEEEVHLFPVVLKLLDAPQRAILAREILTRQAGLAQMGQPRRAASGETRSAAPLK